MHSYNCPKEITQSLNKLYPNFFYSFSMNIANKLESLNNIEPDKLLLETDAPYQYNGIVVPGGDKSHPKHIVDLVKFCSAHLGIDLT